jgi:hypothetical protein
MEIIQVQKPTIIVDDVEIVMISRMFKDLIGFQSEINRKEKLGYTKCYFMSLYTQHEPNLDTIYWLRYKFVK